MRMILNTLGILFTVYILQAVGMGIRVDTFWWALLAAFVLGVLNTLIRPVLLLLTLPLNILTLGLFTFVLNGFLFWLMGVILQAGVQMADFWTALAASLVYSVFSVIFSRAFVR
ncbi:MAG: phage holin family protein [bacterium]